MIEDMTQNIPITEGHTHYPLQVENGEMVCRECGEVLQTLELLPPMHMVDKPQRIHHNIMMVNQGKVIPVLYIPNTRFMKYNALFRRCLRNGGGMNTFERATHILYTRLIHMLDFIGLPMSLNPYFFDCVWTMARRFVLHFEGTNINCHLICFCKIVGDQLGIYVPIKELLTTYDLNEHHMFQILKRIYGNTFFPITPPTKNYIRIFDQLLARISLPQTLHERALRGFQHCFPRWRERHSGKTPYAFMGSYLYTFGRYYHQYWTQTDCGDWCGITEITLRSVQKQIGNALELYLQTLH